jgi:hypothetical protein
MILSVVEAIFSAEVAACLLLSIHARSLLTLEISSTNQSQKFKYRRQLLFHLYQPIIVSLVPFQAHY